MSAQAQMMRDKGYIPATEAAEKIGKTVYTIYRLIDTGKLDGVQVGTFWYVLYESLLDYLGTEAVKLLGLPTKLDTGTAKAVAKKA